MYEITPYTRKKARQIGVIVRPSTNPRKKIDVYKNGVKLASVGGIRFNGIAYMDYPNYIKKEGLEVANRKRRAYLTRHAHEPKWTIKNGVRIRSPSYFADVLLW